jgi:DedD protein
MEKKKLLLVAVSVGVFLVIVMGASILVFSPRPAEIQRAASFQTTQPIQPGSPPQPASVDAADMARNSGELQGLQSPPASATASQENVFYFMGDPDQIVERTTENNETRVVISVPKPSAAAVPALPPRQTAAPAPSASPAPPAPAGRTNTTPAAAPKSAPRPAAKAPAPPAQTFNDYWVQTGSFSTRVRADGVKETLASKGIASIIENRDVEGKTFYRVRIGPYTSQNEANYWLSLIKSIQGFEDSQIWRSQSRR